MSAWWLALFPLASAALLWPCLMGSRVLVGFDRLAIWYPFMSFARSSFSHYGALPMWLPSLFGGLPFVESLVPSLCYPTDILGWLTGVPPNLLFAWDTWLHLAIAGGGAWALARSMGLSGPAALVGGLAYMLNGYLVAQCGVGTTVFIRGAAWLPWIFWAVGLAVRTGRLKWWMAAGAFMALLPLSASYQLFAYLIVAVPVYALAAVFRGQLRNVGPGILVGFALAGLLASVMIVPGALYYLESFRALPGHRWGNMAPFPAAELPLLLVPSLWGRELEGVSKHLGMLPAGLAALALWRKPRATLPWWLLAVVAVLLAFGPQTFLGALIERLPVVGRFRFPSHWLALSHMAIAVIAAYGADIILAEVRRNLRTWTAIWLIAAGILSAGSSLHGTIWNWVKDSAWLKEQVELRHIPPQGLNAEEVGASLRHAAIACVVAGGTCLVATVFPAQPTFIAAVLVISTGSELVWRAAGRIGPVRPEIVPGISQPTEPFLSSLSVLQGPFRIFTEEPAGLANMRIQTGFDWVQGYHGAPPGRLSRFYDAGTMRNQDLPSVFGWLNSRFYIVADPRRSRQLVALGQITNLAGQHLWLCEDPAFLPRAFFVTRVDVGATDDAVLDALCQTPPSQRRVFVAGPRGAALAGRKAPGEVTALDLAPNRIRAEVTSSGDGFLFFSEAWYPAWTGFVDGVRVPIERVNVMFRGIAVPKGRHTVEMVYSSLPFRIGLWMSLAGWAALGGWLGLFVWPRRGRN